MKKFVIFYYARVGSTHLRWLLNSHPKVLCCGELLAKGDIEAQKYINRLGPRAYIGAAELFARRFQIPDIFFEVFGFKLAHFQFRWYFKEMAAFLRSGECKIIHVYRENCLEHAISFQLSQRTNIHCQFETDDCSQYRDIRFELNVEETIEKMRFNEQHFLRYKELFQGSHYMEVSYEQFTGPDSESVLANIQTWLGLDPTFLSSPLFKQNTRSPEEIVLNYDSVKHLSSWRMTPKGIVQI